MFTTRVHKAGAWWPTTPAPERRAKCRKCRKRRPSCTEGPAMNYAAPCWLPGGNLQTIWAALRSRRYLGPAPVFRRERWDTPDQDFVDVDWLDDAPTFVT